MTRQDTVGGGVAHTSGPWIYRPSGDGFVIRSKNANGPIAGINGSKPLVEAEANARLLSSALVLFEALSELADLMQGVIDGDYKPDSFTLQPARAALKTAGGGE